MTEDGDIVLDMWLLRIAETCYEANRAICVAMNDFSQKSWAEADKWEKLSVIRGVKFTIDNLASTPKDQHDAWMRDKFAEGWVYGRTKDPEKKTHPCLVSYETLPKNQQIKDYVFQAIVKSLWGIS